MDELTEKQKVFCREYIYDWNATRAYKVAYPTVKNDNVAAAASNRLLRNVKILDYIESIQKELEKLAGISRLRVINEFQKIAFSSSTNIRSTWMELKEFEQLTEDEKSCIQEIETKIIRQKNYTMSTPGAPVFDNVEYVKIKLYDKQKALENISKMLGYNEPEKKEVKLEMNELPGNISIVYRDAD